MSDPLMATYQRLPVAFVRGSGARLWDADGREYLDAVAGIAVCGLGHAHPEVARALARQAECLVHTSNLYEIPLQRALGARLTALAGMDNAFFCNSGAEANEAAIKLTRLHARRRGIGAPVVAVAEGGFHGRTMGTLSATASAKVRAGFEPLLPGFEIVSYADAGALEYLDAARTVAVMVEPLQGEGGVVVPPEGYLRELRRICDERDWLLVFDEIQSGLCRTGRWFACQHEGVTPDVMTLAKSLGNGVPIGACLARGPAADLMQPGGHGSTFGGNPLACAAATAVLDVLERERLAERAAELGTWMRARLAERLAGDAGVREVRGRGLMIGVELAEEPEALVERGLERGLLLNVTAGRVLRLLPPLTLTDAQAERVVDGVVEVLAEP